MKSPDDEDYEENEEEEDEDEEEEEEEEPPTDMINEDLSPEERQEEFIKLVKERFVDGKDPEYDYNQLASKDNIRESDLTDTWFDEEEETLIEPSGRTASGESEDDYMTMDLSNF